MEGKCQTNLSCPLNFKLLKKREKKRKKRRKGFFTYFIPLNYRLILLMKFSKSQINCVVT